MNSFNFRLDRVLSYRKYLEKKAQQDLFCARNEYIKKGKEIKKLAKQRKEIANKCGHEEFRGIYVPMYRIYQAFIRNIEYDLEKAHISLKKREERVMEQEEVLKKESIKKKTLETLKDLQHKKYIETSAREEQKVLDEIVITRGGPIV